MRVTFDSDDRGMDRSGHHVANAHMLSIGKLGVAGGADYYLDKVANSVDDYYLGRGEAPGQWIGQRQRRSGWSDRSIPRPSGTSWPACPPAERTSGAPGPAGSTSRLRPHVLGAEGRLAAVGFGARRRAGCDLRSATIGRSAPFSISLSTEACFVRRGPGGRQLIEANGFIGAAFRHRTSRAGDPQLHTHVVVPNLVKGADGRWSAPDGRHLYMWQKTAGTLYQSALRAELTPLGLTWQVRQNGLGELRDIPKPILRAFSKRRVDIESAMEDRGTVVQGGRDGHARHPGPQASGWRPDRRPP